MLETSYKLTHTPDGCVRVAAAVAPFLEALGDLDALDALDAGQGT